MKIVSFLQCQWFPEKSIKYIEYAYSKHGTTPEGRARLSARYLFFRCQTGKRLKSVFGDLTDDIIWENSTPKIATQSSGSFPPDPQYMSSIINHFKPDIVMTFGKIAANGLELTIPLIQSPSFKILNGPHPTARGSGIMDQLRKMAIDLNGLIND